MKKTFQRAITAIYVSDEDVQSALRINRIGQKAQTGTRADDAGPFLQNNGADVGVEADRLRAPGLEAGDGVEARDKMGNKMSDEIMVGGGSRHHPVHSDRVRVDNMGDMAVMAMDVDLVQEESLRSSHRAKEA